MIDLHLHTNASDGRCAPFDLVSRAVDARLSVIAVTDHDTVSGLDEVARHASAAALRLIPGIEITAVWNDRDVHVLGYYLDATDARLAEFLGRQRVDRMRRVHLMLERLAQLGMPIGLDVVVAPVAGRTPDAVGRPQVARALVARGFAPDENDAFARFLSEGRPGYVPRIGSAPAEVVSLIAGAGGIASLAHPGLLAHDDLIPGMVEAGMQAIEVYHPDHDAAAIQHYRAIARRFGLAVTGGSDFHGDGSHGGGLPGLVTLPPDDFARLEAVRERH